ncbi:unnamed protein product [Parnassius mnemosyne]|uniref:BED-type domain-containing protein n=1 Tax=Parnassius mnemosyne TaxID=213953 RepID=A0AAV1LUL5_9NEOP
METSKVWKYFKKNKDASNAQCLKCPKTIACKGSNTSGLVRHLAHVHKIDVRSTEVKMDTEEASTSSSSSGVTAPKKLRSDFETMHVQQTLKFDVQPRKSLGEILAKLSAQDGFTIRGITKSEFIRESLAAKGYKLPKTQTEVMNLILKFYDEKEKEMIKELSQLCTSPSGNRLSVTIDEWTSIRNRRYFSVCVHTAEAKVYNLGLVYIPGKCGAAEVREIVEERLKYFGVNFEHYVLAVTSDGPNVMKKFGRESPCEMVLCVNHAIHLAILDTFCKKKTVTTVARRNTPVSDDEHSSSDEASTDNDDEESDDESILQPIDDINKVLNETRSIIRFFRKSPLRNITLQKHVKTEFGAELVLLQDVRTRWNSMLTMIERFLKLKNSIKKALIDLDSSFKWKEENIPILQKLRLILTPTKLAVEALSRQDANLLTAEAITDVLLKQLESIDDPLALQLVESLKMKISDRRNTPLISLLRYLNSPDNFILKKSAYFTDNSKTFLIGYAEDLFNRLYPTVPTTTEPSTGNNSEVVEAGVSESETEQDSFAAQLERAIKGVSRNGESTNAVVLSKSIIKKEFLLFEKTGKRTPNLETLYKALISVKQTSTENERVFSISGNVVSKIRSRLSDKSINALVYLKAYFIRINKQA